MVILLKTRLVDRMPTESKVDIDNTNLGSVRIENSISSHVELEFTISVVY